MKIMNEAEMFKLAQNLDEDAKQYDFSEEEYICTDENFDAEMKNKSSIVNKNCKNLDNKKKCALFNAKFKEKYFDFYDDIKIPSHKVTDW